MRREYVLSWCSVLHSLSFVMQHARVLKKLNFDLWTPTPEVHPGGETQAFDQKSRLICFIFIVPRSAFEISVKNIVNLLN